MLVSNGASLSVNHANGSTPIIYCLENDMVDLALAIIPSAEDAASFPAKNGKTPLVVACSLGQCDVIEALLSAGANVDDSGPKDGPTPLHTVVKCSRDLDGDDVSKAIALLIERGACVTTENPDGESVLTAAFAAGVESSIIDSVIIPAAGENAAATDGKGDNPLFLAVGMELLDTLQALVDAGCDIMVKNGDGKTILTYVLGSKLSSSSKADIVAKIVELGGSKIIECSDDIGDLPLHVALASEDTKDLAVEVLLPLAEDSVNAITKNGRSPLWLACKRGDLEIAEALLSKGAKVNEASEKDGTTPLQIAIASSNADITSLLISNGADADIKDKAGRSCLEIAFKAKAVEVVDSLLGAGANPDIVIDGVSLVSLAVQNGSSQTLQSLIDNGADLDVASEDGSTALFCAFKLGKKGIDSFKMLLENGANPNVKFSKSLFGKEGAPSKAKKGKYTVKSENGVCIRKNMDLRSNVKKFLPCKSVCNVTDSGSADGIEYVKVDNGWAPSRLANSECQMEPLDEFAGKGIADQTSLVLAVVKLKKGDLLDALLEAGADIDAEDEDGATARKVALSADRELPKWDKWSTENKEKISGSTPVCVGTYTTKIGGEEVKVDVKVDKKKIVTKYLSGEMDGKPYFKSDLKNVVNAPGFPLSFKANYSEDGKNKDTFITLLSSTKIIVHRYEQDEEGEKISYDHCKMTFDGEGEDVFSGLNDEFLEAYGEGINYGDSATKMKEISSEDQSSKAKALASERSKLVAGKRS